MPVQPIKEKSTMMYKVAIVVLVIIIIVFGGFVATGFSVAGSDPNKAGANIKALYEIITGSTVDVMKVQDVHGLYQVTLRYKDTSGRDTLADVYVTKDGLYSTDTLVDLELQKSALTNQSAFAQCLYNKNVRIIGLSTDQTTQVQLQALGAFSPILYIDCGGQNLAVCQQLNITTIPVIFVNGQIIQGPQSAQWFSQNLGCYLTADGNAP